MAPFDSLFLEPWRLEQIRSSGRPVVGHLCNFAPEELIFAAGAVPLRLDVGHSEAAAAGGRILAPDICPEVRSLVGALCGRLPYHDLVDLMVIPTACDGKKKLVQVWEGETWIMELPQQKTGARHQAWWQEEVKSLAHRLHRLTGRKVGRAALKRAVRLYNQRTDLCRRMNTLRQTHPGILDGRDALLVMQASFIADPIWWVEQAGALVEELEQRAKAPEETAGGGDLPRLLLIGSPMLLPDYRLLDIVAQCGAVVVADELCSGTQRLHHPVVVDEWSRGGLLRAVADKGLLPCTCPCFVSGEHRIHRILELARSSRATGVIHHTLRLCQLFDMELPAVTAALREQGLPLLNIHTEYGSEDAALIKNRVEAFLEMLSPDLQ